MTVEQKIIGSKSGNLLEEMVVFALKPGSLIEAAHETIKNGGDDFKLAIYPGLAIAEATRLATYFWVAYCVGDILTKYFY